LRNSSAANGAMAAAVSDQQQQAKRSGLKTRVLSAAVMLPVAVAAVWFGGWAFAALVVVAAVAMLWEWLRLPGRYAHDKMFAGGFGLLASLYFAMDGRFDWALTIVFSGALVLGVRSSRHFLWHAAGFLYIGLPCLALLWLRNQPEHGLQVVFWLMVIVWATDIGAYFAGRTIGGPKLIPSISPNKTWAGLIGGMICAAIASAIMVSMEPGLPVLALAILGAVLAVVAQAGDFTESAVKRHFKVKDASNLIPGHGGVLDRVDGLLFAAPTAALILLYWRDRLWP
jgi:phosphatidate cytidylyltransferase